MAYLACADTVMPDRSIFLVGQDGRGRYCVHETHGLIGGAFITRAQAIHFAQVESQAIPGSIVLITPQLIELSCMNDHAAGEPDQSVAVR